MAMGWSETDPWDPANWDDDLPVAQLRCARCCVPLERESTGVSPEDCDMPGSILVLNAVLRCPKCGMRYRYGGVDD